MIPVSQRHCSSIYSCSPCNSGPSSPRSIASSSSTSSSKLQCDNRPAAYGITFYIYDKPLPPLPEEAKRHVQKPLPPLPLNFPSSRRATRPMPVKIPSKIYFDEKEVYIPYSDEKEVFQPYFDEKQNVL